MNAPAPTELLNLADRIDAFHADTRGAGYLGDNEVIDRFLISARQAASVGAEAAADWIWKDGKPVGAEVAGEAVAWQRRFKGSLVSSWETIPDDRAHLRHDMERQGWEIRGLALASPSRSEKE